MGNTNCVGSFGWHHSDETKSKIRCKNRGKRRSDETKKKLSLACLERFKNKENHPWYGKSRSEEDKIKADNFLCYVDGYDKEHNVVLEYDGKYHHIIGQQKRDLVRQKNIIDILHPKKFWRYNSVNKIWNEVIKGGVPDEPLR